MTFPSLPLNGTSCTYLIQSHVLMHLSDSNTIDVYVEKNYLSEATFAYPIPPLSLTGTASLQCLYLPQDEYLSIDLVTPTLPTGVVVDYIWKLTKGELVAPCINQNCGGDHYPFLYLPGNLLQSCAQYQWTVTATYSNGETSTTSDFDTCTYTVLEPPHDGKCTLTSNSSKSIESGESITVPEFSSVTISCFDWKLGCSDSTDSLIYEVYIYDVNGPVYTGSSITSTFPVPIGSSTTLNIWVCDKQNVCNVDTFFYVITTSLSEDEKTPVIANLLNTTQNLIDVGNFQQALALQLAIISGYDVCSSQSTEQEELLTTLVLQTLDLFNAEAEAAGFAYDSLPDPSPLLQTWAVIGEKSCVPVFTIFEVLLDICKTRAEGTVASVALDHLLALILSNVSQSDLDHYEDLAIQINMCFQNSTGPVVVGDPLPVNYTGSVFSYYQQVVPMLDFSLREVSFEIPGAVIYLPLKFNVQINNKFHNQVDPNFDISWVTLHYTQTNLYNQPTLQSVLAGVTVHILYHGVDIILELGHGDLPLSNVVIQLWKVHPVGRSVRYTLDVDIVNTSSCSYYLTNDTFTTDGCTAIGETNEFVNCSCIHFSNFGLLC